MGGGVIRGRKEKREGRESSDLVGSISVVRPGLINPRSSAFSIMLRPMRSCVGHLG